ncbi:hypothetical protein TRICI_001486 [Trichomonascus ciferrii]|uniref:Glycosyltransferase family 15 protein n=1 Tax=Trichomonascus ciferrii TaxID=44093 RepID=A0A642V9Y7_9ASCO|nr:hypothetical protein TRICI_001486 [Trichomonascus ciferrii]
MRLWFKRLGSRIIYPYDDEKGLLNGEKQGKDSNSKEYGSHTLRFLIRIWRYIRFVAGIRIRLTHNITTPLLMALFLPLILLAVSTLVLLRIFGGKTFLEAVVVNKTPRVREISSQIDKPFVIGCAEPQVDQPRANAVLVVLARNSEIEGVTQSIRSLERHFNRWFNYPYVFLNDEPFNSTFKQAIMNVTKSRVEFGTIDEKDWNFPEWADEEEVAEAIAQQGDRAIMYGNMESYHKMCRFYSGKFFNHPLLLKYDWYWRVEPDVKYFCDITYDPFVYMQKHNKVYGFTIVIKELVETVPNLFRQTTKFKRERNMTSTGLWELFIKHPGDDELEKAETNNRDSGSVRRKKAAEKKRKEEEQKQREQELKEHLPDEAFLDKDSYRRNKYKKLSYEWDEWDAEDGYVHPEAMYGEVYNMCHFWSNFEIARMDFFRSKEYSDFFDSLERSGGFWTERWGDAPVHSLAAGLFLEPEQVHYFRDIGYRHTTIQHCPANAPQRQRPHVPYITDENDKQQLEEDEYWANYDPEVINGVGCRCRCDKDVVEIEGKDGSCLSRWVDIVGGWV